MAEQGKNMQPGSGKPGVKAGLPVADKPYLKGKAFGKPALTRGLRILGFLLLSAVLYLFLGQLLAVESAWLRILLNISVLLVAYFLMFMDGAQSGEREVAYAEIALSRQEAGKPAKPAELARCFHPGKGFVSALIGVLPVFLLCLVYAFMAVRESYTLGTLPSWLAPYQARPDIGLALSYYQEGRGLGLIDFLRAAVRLLVFPFINLAGGSRDGVLLVERLSPLLVLLPPLSHAIGYLWGEQRRAIVHGSIATNARKAARKQQKKRQPPKQEPRQLI